jgi:folate-binding protein YgfZ
MATQAPTDLESDYRLLREAAGMLDGQRGVVELAGPDAVEYLQGQLTNDVAALAPGRGCYALLLNPKGRILADARVLMLSPETLRLDTEPEALGELLSNLTMYKIGRQVAVTDRSAEWELISLIGPQARDRAGLAVPAAENSFAESELDGVRTLSIATDTGLDVAYAPADRARIRDALALRGAEPVGMAAAEVLRIERGRPRFGIDMGADNLPGELGLEQRAVSFSKGCYVGQEPVARMYHRGHPNRHLRGLRVSAPVHREEPVWSGERRVGAVTSAGVSPGRGPIALALVRREVDPGDSVEVGDARTFASVVELPFPRDE